MNYSRLILLIPSAFLLISIHKQSKNYDNYKLLSTSTGKKPKNVKDLEFLSGHALRDFADFRMIEKPGIETQPELLSSIDWVSER
jgi:hypothetical protein